MSRVELFEKIRNDHRQGMSIRALADKHEVHRRTVRQAIASSTPPPRKCPERVSPALGPWKATIRRWLEDDVTDKVPKKQRHTAHRVWMRLVDECGARVSESTVRAYVAEVKAELYLAAMASVPQTKRLGGEAEVDFGEFYTVLAGERLRVWMFVMRLSASGKAFRKAYVHECGESFYDGHNDAFVFFGGVPTGMIRYDNLKAAVLKVLLGRERECNEKFVALRSHYGFTSFFCQPGQQGAHEKGGVEGEIGRFRRNQLVPLPAVDTIDELNELIAVRGGAEDAVRRIHGRRLDNGVVPTIDEHFAFEQPRLAPLPDDGVFDVAVEVRCRVDAKARICYRQAYYSVPAGLVGRRGLRVRVDATHLQAFDGGRVVARHQRLAHKHTESLQLDHYLEILSRKPGALAGSTPLAQARAAGVFTDAHERFWVAARHKLGDAAGTRALIEVLLEHRRLPAEIMISALAAANSAGITNPQVVLTEARAAADRRPPAEVIPIGGLEVYDRAPPDVAGYDTLLAGAAAGGQS
jgi:transposase